MNEDTVITLQMKIHWWRDLFMCNTIESEIQAKKFM